MAIYKEMRQDGVIFRLFKTPDTRNQSSVLRLAEEALSLPYISFVEGSIILDNLAIPVDGNETAEELGSKMAAFGSETIRTKFLLDENMFTLSFLKHEGDWVVEAAVPETLNQNFARVALDLRLLEIYTPMEVNVTDESIRAFMIPGTHTYDELAKYIETIFSDKKLEFPYAVMWNAEKGGLNGEEWEAFAPFFRTQPSDYICALLFKMKPEGLAIGVSWNGGKKKTELQFNFQHGLLFIKKNNLTEEDFNFILARVGGAMGDDEEAYHEKFPPHHVRNYRFEINNNEYVFSYKNVAFSSAEEAADILISFVEKSPECKLVKFGFYGPDDEFARSTVTTKLTREELVKETVLRKSRKVVLTMSMNPKTPISIGLDLDRSTFDCCINLDGNFAAYDIYDRANLDDYAFEPIH